MDDRTCCVRALVRTVTSRHTPVFSTMSHTGRRDDLHMHIHINPHFAQAASLVYLSSLTLQTHH